MGGDAALPESHQAAVVRFARYLGGLGRSPDTVRLYAGAVRRWFAAGGAPDVLDRDLLLRYLAVRRQALAVATVNIDIKALRAFYAVQADFGGCSDVEYCKLPKMRRSPTRLPRFLTPDQIGEVLGALPLDSYVGIRDYAIIRTLYETGLRSSELARMQIGSVLDDRTIYVERGKGGVDRYVPFGQELQGVLEGYLRARARLRPGKLLALWLTRDGAPLRNGRSVWEIVSRRVWAALGTRAGYDRIRGTGRAWAGHYPHELRASFATALLRGGCSITAIGQMMGHARLETTALYLGVDLDQLRAAAGHHPRALRVLDDAR
jgi:integrase/recombinase XerD